MEIPNLQAYIVVGVLIILLVWDRYKNKKDKKNKKQKEKDLLSDEIKISNPTKLFNIEDRKKELTKRDKEIILEMGLVKTEYKNLMKKGYLLEREQESIKAQLGVL